MTQLHDRLFTFARQGVHINALGADRPTVPADWATPWEVTGLGETRGFRTLTQAKDYGKALEAFALAALGRP